MARVTAQGIELKCRRCKRVVVLAADQVRNRWVAVTVHGDEAMSR
jgi:phage FluMu protein Com